MLMKEVIAPVSRQTLKQELNERLFLRPTNKGGNEIYDFHASEAPNVMREIGRIREIAFRRGGGGTGEPIDVDRFDMSEPYRQLIVWDPDNEEIVGGYRYIFLRDAAWLDSGEPDIVSTHMFGYSEEFLNNYIDNTAELGRAFIHPLYHTRDMGIKSIVGLDNLWDGLGALVYNHPELKHMIGKVTIYPDYNTRARELLYVFLERYFSDSSGLLKLRHPITISPEAYEEADRLFEGDDKQSNYSRLKHAVREKGALTPPLFNAYIGLSNTMQTFGTGINDEFGNIYDTGMMINVDDIFPEKTERYIQPYIDYLKQKESKNCMNRTSAKQQIGSTSFGLM